MFVRVCIYEHRCDTEYLDIKEELAVIWWKVITDCGIIQEGGTIWDIIVETEDAMPVTVPFHIVCDNLDVRSSPSASSPIVRSLGYRDSVDVLGVGGYNVWLQVGENEWIQAKYANETFCIPGAPPEIATHPTGFMSPVGTEEERLSGSIWPGKWFNATPYAKKYGQGVHTGADLNLNLDTQWNADKGADVYAIAPGTVVFAGLLEGTWGNVVIIEHPPMSDGTPVYSRYAHLATLRISAGDMVDFYTVIGTIGTMPGWPGHDHLHVDVSLTDILKREPWHWPGFGDKGLALVKQHYVSVERFLVTYSAITRCNVAGGIAAGAMGLA